MHAAPTPDVQRSIVETVQACRRIQADGDIPVACEFGYAEGVPFILMAFPDLSTLESHFEPMTRFVGAPFCDAANRVSRQAYLGVVVLQQMRVYGCEAGVWSGWIPVDEDARGRSPVRDNGESF